MESGGPIRVALIVLVLGAWFAYRRWRGAVTAGTWALVLAVGANVVSTIIRRGSKPDGWWAGADPRLVTLLTNILIIVSLLGLVLFRAYIVGETDRDSIQKRLRTPAVVAVCAAVVMCACTAWAISTGDPMEMYNRPDISWPAGIFAAVGRGYMAFIFGGTAAMAVRTLLRADLLTRIGLILVSAGCLALAVATAVDTLAAVLSLAAVPVPDTHDLVARSDMFGALGLILGIVVPVLLGRIRAGAVWVHSWVLYRRLAPLYQLIQQLYPELMLTTDMSHARASERMRFRARRAMTESADGLARLRGELPEHPQAAELAELAREYAPQARQDRVDAVDTMTRTLTADTKQLIRLSQAVRRRMAPGSADSRKDATQ